MSKTKTEIELEIRVRALEDYITEMVRSTPVLSEGFAFPELAEHKMKYFNEMKAKHPELKIQYPM